MNWIELNEAEYISECGYYYVAQEANGRWTANLLDSQSGEEDIGSLYLHKQEAMDCCEQYSGVN